ncbi:hypothetical protein ACHAP5_004514 [Fusarium lateritium]
MASTGVNVRVILPDSAARPYLNPKRSTIPEYAIFRVLRWSALGLGIFYGFTHQRAITASQKAEHAQHKYEKKEKLIQQAKAEFAKKKNPTSGDSVITDPSDPKFDLEKLLLKVQKESP